MADEGWLCFENTCIRGHICHTDCLLHRNVLAGEKEVRFRYPSSNNSLGAHPQCFLNMLKHDVKEIEELIVDMRKLQVIPQ